MTIIGSFSYDAINKRERFLTDIISGGNFSQTNTVYLYNQQTEYIYDVVAQTCTKKSITSPWINAGVPKNATLVSTGYIGAEAIQGENIQIAYWSAEIQSTTVPGEIITFTGVFSLKACLPIFSIYESPSLGRIRYGFFDIVPGIKDPSVFVPPRPCLA